MHKASGLAKGNQWKEALELLISENPMPAITGRVCNHPCENLCNRCSFDGAVAIHADSGDAEAVRGAVTETVQRLGRLDVLVNNAGIAFVGPTEDTTLEAWRRMLAVNLDGVFLGTKHAIRHGRSSTLICSIRLAPERPASSRSHVASRPHASGVTRPAPVMTTRRFMGRGGP